MTNLTSFFLRSYYLACSTDFAVCCNVVGDLLYQPNDQARRMQDDRDKAFHGGLYTIGRMRVSKSRSALIRL